MNPSKLPTHGINAGMMTGSLALFVRLRRPIHVRIITSANNEVGIKAKYMVRFEYSRMSRMFIGHLIVTLSFNTEGNSKYDCINHLRDRGERASKTGPCLPDH